MKQKYVHFWEVELLLLLYSDVLGIRQKSEGQRVQWSKHCDYNNQDVGTSLDTSVYNENMLISICG